MINVTHLSKIYQTGTLETRALDDVSFNISTGEFVAIMGSSGSGKSTLMHILGCLDRPSSGKYVLDALDVSDMTEDQLADIRNTKIGFIFQAYNLLPRTSALKNVVLPLKYAGISKAAREARGEKYLKLVGLENRLHHTSNQLSGGQQQRVAIARALSMEPKILLADEPTGNLATAQSHEIMEIFTGLHADGHTIIMITHEPSIASYAARIITMRDGTIESDKLNKKPTLTK